MDEYLTDQQQAEKLQRWWTENGAFVIAGRGSGVGGLFGWRQWENYQLAQAEMAAAAYEQLLLAIGGNRTNEAAEVPRGEKRHVYLRIYGIISGRHVKGVARKECSITRQGPAENRGRQPQHGRAVPPLFEFPQ